MEALATMASLISTIAFWASLTASVLGASTARSAECDELDLKITTTPTLPQFSDALHYYMDAIHSVPTGPIDLLLIGDSLVWGWKDPNELIPAHKGIWNFGAVGDRVQNVLWRLQSDELTRLAPKNVVLLIGTNNVGARDKPCATLAGIRAITDRIQQLWPRAKFYIMLIPPRGPGGKELDVIRNQLNDDIRKLAASNEWGVIDSDATLMCNFRQPCNNYRSDWLHPNEAGYRALTNLLYSALNWAE